jgi:hypothetical protein
VLRAALILLLCLCPVALTAAEDDLAPPGFSLRAPWGLWAERAPYPFYDGPFGMNARDDLVARDLWFDFQAETIAGRRYSGGAAHLRARVGLFSLDFSYGQLGEHRPARLIQTRHLQRWDSLLDGRAHLGFTLPLSSLGYLDAGVGGVAFQETGEFSRMGVSFCAAALVFPFWPLGLEGEYRRAEFFNGRAVDDFSVRVHVQVFRHLFVTGGWRGVTVRGTGFESQGATFGLSLHWSNLRTFFWAPMRGPAW